MPITDVIISLRWLVGFHVTSETIAVPACFSIHPACYVISNVLLIVIYQRSTHMTLLMVKKIGEILIHGLLDQ